MIIPRRPILIIFLILLAAHPGSIQASEPGGTGTGLSGLFQQMGIKGRIDYRLNFGGKKKGNLGLVIDGKGLTAQDPGFLYALDGVDLSCRGEMRYGNSPWLDMDCSSRKGEVLVGDYYLNLAETPFQLTGQTLLGPGNRFVSVETGNLRIGNVIDAAVEGTFRSRNGDGEVSAHLHIPSQPIAGLLDKAVREPLSLSRPELAKAAWSGSWELDVQATGPLAHPAIEGRLAVNGLNLELEAPSLRIADVTGDFPIWLIPGDTQPGEPSSGDYGRWGNLEIGELATPLFQISGLKLPLRAMPNSLELTEPVRFRLWNGNVEIRHFTMTRPLLPGQSGELALKSEALDLSPLIEKALGEPVAAILTTEGIHAQLKDGRVDFSGTLLLNVFSGKVEIRPISIVGLFSASPVLNLEATWKELDLAEITRVTRFGLITGSLDGSLKNLRIAGVMPLGFDLSMETVEREADQTISVTAVDNISRMGNSASPFQGAAGIITELFNDFAYRKIAIHCTLKNDFFTIKGLAGEGGTEYLVKRGMTGVDVINRNPGGRISWTDMLNRLKRIKRTGSSEAGKGAGKP